MTLIVAEKSVQLMLCACLRVGRIEIWAFVLLWGQGSWGTWHPQARVSSAEGVLTAECVVQNPIQAIVQHSEHNVLYAQDPLMQGFHARHISHMLDVVCENQGQTGFSVAEVGAGTGGFTRQVGLLHARLCSTGCADSCV